MFRGCFFEYAGIYSGDYNLMMMYIENSYDNFNSGGSYEPVVSNLPGSLESLLYGLNYSEKPLEFSVEIINIDGVISIEQMQEIKDWLFGQDGWKSLRLMDENFRAYHLKCLFIPDEDIVDASGYRGVRCTLRNISAFWYGDDEKIIFSKSDLETLAGENGKNISSGGNIKLDINIKGCAKYVYPKIEFIQPSDSSSYDNKFMKFRIENNLNTDKESRINFWLYPQLSNCTYSLDLKNMVFTHSNPNNPSENQEFYYQPNNLSGTIFYLTHGNNSVLLNVKKENQMGTQDYTLFERISFSYTPVYRIGGF